jgi:hypothetical protein
MKPKESSDLPRQPFASGAGRVLGPLKLAAAVIAVIVLYLLQDWVFVTQDTSAKYLFSGWVLAAGAAIYALIADRGEADIPWWWIFAALLLGSLIHVVQAFGTN